MSRPRSAKTAALGGASLLILGGALWLWATRSAAIVLDLSWIGCL